MTSFGVVVPLHNGASVLRDALDSLYRQSLPPEQVVVVDDGSTDGGAQLAANHPLRPTIVELSENHGVAFARNLGAARLDTEFVAFLDQDDMWLPCRLERLAYNLSRNPEWNVLTTSERVFACEEDREALGDHAFGGWIEHWISRAGASDLLDRIDPGAPVTTSSELSLKHLLNWTVTVTTSYVIRRELYFSVGGCAPWLRSGDDWILLQNLARHSTIHRVDDPTVLYRVHPSNTSTTTEWATPILAAALGVRRGQGLVPRGQARSREAVGALADSEFLMNLLVGLIRGRRLSDLGDAVALAHLLGTDRADRFTVSRRMTTTYLRSLARSLKGAMRSADGRTGPARAERP
ncbi:MAG: glycosyl transferase family 2 [Pseudonocardiales bacterium]|nr:glycosyl transferase family 2 [Pseudonocardiales bacterium]